MPTPTPTTATKAEQIWQVLGQIPCGSVASYGQLAELAGLPGCARLVGTTLKKLPDGSKLPWHRVVNAAGKISFSEESPKYLEQKQRLQSEGVLLVNRRVPMTQYRWHP